MRTLIVLLLGATVIAPTDIRTNDGTRVGTIKQNPVGQGRYDLYAPNGERLGYGKTRPDGTIEVFRPNGQRGLAPKGKK